MNPNRTRRSADGPSAVERLLSNLPRGTVVTVDAVSDADLDVFALGLRRYESSGGKRTLCRTAASMVNARLLPGEGATPPLLPHHLWSGFASTNTTLLLPPRPPPSLAGGSPSSPAISFAHLRPGPGVVICGSYVPKTSAQLASVRTAIVQEGLPVDVLETSASLLAQPESGSYVTARAAEVARISSAADAALRNGRSVLIFTSRTLIRGADPASALQLHARVAAALVNVIRTMAVNPAWVISKGGITSADMARSAYTASSGWVLGQAAPGVPLWLLDGKNVRVPYLPLVVFPGNVGDEQALTDLVRAWGGPGTRSKMTTANTYGSTTPPTIMANKSSTAHR